MSINNNGNVNKNLFNHGFANLLLYFAFISIVFSNPFPPSIELRIVYVTCDIPFAIHSASTSSHAVNAFTHTKCLFFFVGRTVIQPYFDWINEIYENIFHVAKVMRVHRARESKMWVGVFVVHTPLTYIHLHTHWIKKRKQEWMLNKNIKIKTELSWEGGTNECDRSWKSGTKCIIRETKYYIHTIKS